MAAAVVRELPGPGANRQQRLWPQRAGEGAEHHRALPDGRTRGEFCFSF